MPRDEAERLLSAAFAIQDGAALQLMDPVSRRKWSVHDACRNTAALPDVLELVAHNAAPAAVAPSNTALNTESRPLLHHNQHSHRVQPYQPHNRQQSRTAHQFSQAMLDEMQQQQQQQQTAQQQQQPQSPNSPPASSTGISFPPPFVLSLHSLTDLAQALQLSEHLIVLLFIVSPASASASSIASSSTRSSCESTVIASSFRGLIFCFAVAVDFVIIGVSVDRAELD